MNGPEHYAEAERILDSAAAAPSDLDVMINVAAAQVHATLALAAATALAEMVTPQWWLDVAS